VSAANLLFISFRAISSRFGKALVPCTTVGAELVGILVFVSCHSGEYLSKRITPRFSRNTRTLSLAFILLEISTESDTRLLGRGDAILLALHAFYIVTAILRM
jgi:hypothetical protein